MYAVSFISANHIKCPLVSLSYTWEPWNSEAKHLAPAAQRPAGGTGLPPRHLALQKICLFLPQVALLAPGTLEENAEDTDQLEFPLIPLYDLKNAFSVFLLNRLEWTYLSR